MSTFHSLYGTYPFTTQLRHIPNGIPLAKQTYYFPISTSICSAVFTEPILRPSFPPFSITASVLIAIGMRYYHVPIAHRSKAWLSLYYFGLQSIVLKSWITSLTLLRNAYYHHLRVEDKVSSIMPVSPRRIAHSTNRPTSYTLG